MNGDTEETKQIRVNRRLAELVEGLHVAKHGGKAQDAYDAALQTWLDNNAPTDWIDWIDDPKGEGDN